MQNPNDNRPKGICPNCWGRQQWENRFYDVARDEQIDITNNKKREAFINDFVKKYVEGIRLHKDGPKYTRCQTCRSRFDSDDRPVDKDDLG